MYTSSYACNEVLFVCKLQPTENIEETFSASSQPETPDVVEMQPLTETDTSVSEISRPSSALHSDTAVVSAKKQKLSRTSSAEQVMTEAKNALKNLTTRTPQDHYVNFGATVAGEVRSLPTDIERSMLMTKIMQTITEFKQDLHTRSSRQFMSTPVHGQYPTSTSPSPGQQCTPQQNFRQQLSSPPQQYPNMSSASHQEHSTPTARSVGLQSTPPPTFQQQLSSPSFQPYQCNYESM